MKVGELKRQASERQPKMRRMTYQNKGQLSESFGQPDSPPCMSSRPTAPSDISKCMDDTPVQPYLKTFSTTLMGDRRCSFQVRWYENHPWIEYSVMMDSVFCFA